jgi:hypothetical protein
MGRPGLPNFFQGGEAIPPQRHILGLLPQNRIQGRRGPGHIAHGPKIGIVIQSLADVRASGHRQTPSFPSMMLSGLILPALRPECHVLSPAIIRTTRSAGGLSKPYKGMLLAAPEGALNILSIASSPLAPLEGVFSPARDMTALTQIDVNLLLMRSITSKQAFVPLALKAKAKKAYHQQSWWFSQAKADN